MKNGKFLHYVYFWKDDQTLKISGDFKRYYFDIELESDSNELLESTQFKIVVDRYELSVAAFYAFYTNIFIINCIPNYPVHTIKN